MNEKIEFYKVYGSYCLHPFMLIEEKAVWYLEFKHWYDFPTLGVNMHAFLIARISNE